MSTSRLARRYAAVVVGTILLFSALYSVGMSTFEGRPRTFLESLEIVLQTFTTVGYGQDAPWESTVMSAFVVAMQVVGFLLIFSAFPAVIVPLFEQSLATSPPARREDLADHVVVCRASTHTESLIEELVARGVPYVFVEPDRDEAIDLHERDRTVVHGDPTSMDVLEGVAVSDARAVVSDADDEVDMSIITTVAEVAPDVPVYSIVEDEDFVEYHELAGAEEVFLPRRLLGRGIANKVRNTVTTEVEGKATVGEDFEIAEIPVGAGSELDGERLDDHAGVGELAWNVIGVWSRGHFHTPPYEDVVLEDGAVLLAVGRSVRLESIARSAGSSVDQYGRGAVLVVGHGVVGSIVGRVLARDGIGRTVVDAEDAPGVDVVGDATEEATYEAADLEDARTVVLALDDDTATLVASFIVRNLAPDVEIVARANDAESVPKLHRAGVDYALALSTVAGRLLAAAILGADRSVALDEQVRIVRRSPGDLAGRTLEEAAVRERTGCTVVAVEHRDGRVSADVQGWTEIDESDHLIVAGVDDAIERLEEYR